MPSDEASKLLNDMNAHQARLEVSVHKYHEAGWLRKYLMLINDPELCEVLEYRAAQASVREAERSAQHHESTTVFN